MPKGNSDPLIESLKQEYRAGPRQRNRRNDPDAAGQPLADRPGEGGARRRPMQPPAELFPRRGERRFAAAAGPSMPGASLAEICEPLFLYACRLNRRARLPGTAQAPQASQVRADVQSLLTDAVTTAERVGLSDEFARVRMPLVFFFDDIIVNGSLPFAPQWQRLAREPDGAGGEGFFEMLEAALAATDDAAADRLSVFYTCLGLGFEGKYAGDRERLNGYIGTLSAWLGDHIETGEVARLCPEAYDHTDRRPLSAPVSSRVGAMAVSAAVLVAVAVVFSGTLYTLRTQHLRSDLRTFTTAAMKDSKR